MTNKAKVAKVKRYGMMLMAVCVMGMYTDACDDTTDTITVSNAAETVKSAGDGIDVIVDGFDAVHDAVCTDGDTRAMCNGGVERENPGIGDLLIGAIKVTESVTGYDEGSSE